MSLSSLAKSTVKRILYRPGGIQMGENSFVRRPRTIQNPSRINIGSDCVVHRGVVLNPIVTYEGMPHDGRILIGEGVYIGSNCQIHSIRGVDICDGAVLSDQVYVNDAAHGLDPLAGPIMKQRLESRGPVTIGEATFIGYGCSILSGVTLGKHCVVGTRSVVTRSFPAYSMIAGAPARLIKRFDVKTGRWEPVASPASEA
jgi:acetyltransferase-like isoleucine patch superfamily enzyme